MSVFIQWSTVWVGTNVQSRDGRWDCELSNVHQRRRVTESKDPLAVIVMIDSCWLDA